MLFEVQFLKRHAIVIDTFDLECARALVERFREEQKVDEVVVLAIVPVADEEREAA